MSVYQVKITGAYSVGTTEAIAAQALAKLFKIPEAQAVDVLQQAPIVVKKNVDTATAEKFQQALEKIGIVSVVESVAAAAEAAMDASVERPNSGDSHKSSLEGLVTTESDPHSPGYQFKIEGRPDYAFLTVQMPAESTLKVEASAMATMDANLVMKTKMRGGLGRLLTSESIFINEFTAEAGPAEISIAPGSPGDMGHVYLDGDIVYLQNSAYVASDMGVEVESKWQGLVKGFFSGESLFLIRCSGKGDLWFNTYGAMIEIDIDGDYVVDTGNIVAFTDGLEYNVTKVGGYKSLFFLVKDLCAASRARAKFGFKPAVL